MIKCSKAPLSEESPALVCNLNQRHRFGSCPDYASSISFLARALVPNLSDCEKGKTLTCLSDRHRCIGLICAELASTMRSWNIDEHLRKGLINAVLCCPFWISCRPFAGHVLAIAVTTLTVCPSFTGNLHSESYVHCECGMIQNFHLKTIESTVTIYTFNEEELLSKIRGRMHISGRLSHRGLAQSTQLVLIYYLTAASVSKRLGVRCYILCLWKPTLRRDLILESSAPNSARENTTAAPCGAEWLRKVYIWSTFHMFCCTKLIEWWDNSDRSKNFKIWTITRLKEKLSIGIFSKGNNQF